MSDPFMDLIDDAMRQGWKHEVSGGGHHKLVPPDPDMEIVVTSSTPSDSRAFKNFRASMVRNGYKLPDDRAELMRKRDQRGQIDVLRKVFKENPEKNWTLDELRLVMKARMPGANPDSVSSLLHYLVQQEEIRRPSYGVYCGRKANGVAVAVEEPRIAAVAVAVPPPASDDDDERELNEVLDQLMVAMSRAEKLLRKYNGIIKQANVLRKLLGG